MYHILRHSQTKHFHIFSSIAWNTKTDNTSCNPSTAIERYIESVFLPQFLSTSYSDEEITLEIADVVLDNDLPYGIKVVGEWKVYNLERNKDQGSFLSTVFSHTTNRIQVQDNTLVVLSEKVYTNLMIRATPRLFPCINFLENHTIPL